MDAPPPMSSPAPQVYLFASSRFLAPATSSVSVGDTVFVERGLGRATVVSSSGDSGDSGEEQGRVEVEFQRDRRRAHVAVHRLRRVFAQGASICSFVICAETEEYRLLARTNVPDDAEVIEIGCSTGKCSAVLAQRAKRLLALDIGADVIDQARAAYPDIEFACLDALAETGRLVELMPGCTVLFVDIGGNRSMEALAQLVPVMMQRLPNLRLIVVKNRDLYRSAAKTLKHPADSLSVWWNELADYWCRIVAELEGRKLCASLSTPLGNPPRSLSAWETAYRAARGCYGAGRLLNPRKVPNRTNADGVVICRFQNYSPSLCPGPSTCPFDHQTCHYCLEQGHTALLCTSQGMMAPGRKKP